jgi:hypothetical protein
MRILAAIFITLIPFCSFAGSKQAVLLSPFPGESKPSLTTVINIFGKCGDRFVGILGVEFEKFNEQELFNIEDDDGQRFFHTLSEGDLVIRRGGQEYSYGKALSDFNIVHCVQTKDGFRLLVGGSCGGSGCSDTTYYHIIDVNNGSIFPSESSNENCDKDCANQALGFNYLN